MLRLAKNLYSSKARCIFELLQNADDNSYTVAKSKGEDPYVKFLVYHDRLVVKCNEDGFTEANIRAISNIGKSSKQGAQGYIGEKGIGFKSTFMVAWKVEIESGPFSFHFEHKKTDEGIGKVTPIWFDPETQPSRSTTKITLHFHDQRRPGDIISQLFDIQGTTLLFLKNLRRIDIKLFDETGNKTIRGRQLKMLKVEGSSVVKLHTKQTEQDVSLEDVTQFLVASHTAQNLAKNDNRDYSDLEEENKAYSTAEAVVAFPLDASAEPIVESQHLFAFMPVRQVGFNFLIHSDFVTQANRQDIVTTSERNIGLRQAVGDAFVKGVQMLCADFPLNRTLRYKWMRYLPRRTNLLLDPFWLELVFYLREALSKAHILVCRDQTLHQIASLRRLENEHLDKRGDPLLPDLSPGKYISKEYGTADLDTLAEYGLKDLQVDDIVPRLEAFVTKPLWRSRVFGDRDEDWNSRMAKLIMLVWKDPWMGSLKRLPLLPLSTGVFQSAASSSKVYFPSIKGIAIPLDLDIEMILPAAASNAWCRRLYKEFKVKEVHPRWVRDRVTDKHLGWPTSGLDLQMSVEHLRFLYHLKNNDLLKGVTSSATVVFDQKGRGKRPYQEYVFLPGEGDLAPQILLRDPTDLSKDCDISIIHQAYLDDEPEQPAGKQSWKDFLFYTTWVEQQLRIFTTRDPKPNKPNTKLSKEWLSVAKYHSDRMVTRLQARWAENGKLWQEDRLGSKLISDLEVRCIAGSRHRLGGTFLPFPSMISRCEQLLSNASAVPFVQVFQSLEDSEAPQWIGWADNFGVGATDNLDFSLAILGAITSGKSKTKGTLTQTVLDLYLQIYRQCLGSGDMNAAQSKVR